MRNNRISAERVLCLITAAQVVMPNSLIFISLMEDVSQ